MRQTSTPHSSLCAYFCPPKTRYIPSAIHIDGPPGVHATEVTSSSFSKIWLCSEDTAWLSPATRVAVIAKIAVATFLGEERPKVVLEGGEGVMRAFGDHLGEDARLLVLHLVRVVVERVEKRVEGNHENVWSGHFFFATSS